MRVEFMWKKIDFRKNLKKKKYISLLKPYEQILK